MWLMGGVCVSCSCPLLPGVCCLWFAVCRCSLSSSFLVCYWCRLFGGFGVCRVMVLLGVPCCLRFVVRCV